MKFILLGTGSGMPELGKNQSSLYVNVNGKHLLFDCGEGVSQQLLKHHLDNNVLDAIFISHYHPDHISGLFMLLQMLKIQKREKPLQLFLPERPAALVETLQFLYTFIQKFTFPLHILDCEESELYYEEVNVALTDHLLEYEDLVNESKLPNLLHSYAFRISGPEGSLAYTSDINKVESVQFLIRNCHTVIIDAQHPEADQIIRLQYSGIKRVLLTHGISPTLQAFLFENPIDMFEFAQEDITYII
ncbi:MAG TPA: ribonuclease Z [Candidatus Syntrophosphaera thermopropionivorans]|jgi:ribonuclease BN (tRNA processing enzyme)|uniref:Ribonuclease Z n=1 Tax=Candidatus Syntrophosphaera thermopropionivorans TaxID=2593015 RepID=A0AC61QK17_9BACT|nr:ribonuclease Z [Candidatus Syntrophosphaera thermopropionivorans]MBP9006604.1 ribonuclease Z [Candidatus Syntrophosphaera sp.]NLA44663.1 ribonuclease Z [Candidatus Cloacimonadota bacterium]TDF73683.1 ribonuclease Z [Candidatus Syntrophosphaera thermopropionivorans]HNZ44408.1 ribonuclease Z [Candidatus Syntrophosphaera thermopropionivorans]HOH81968.1 ribonuclease Z [Candidatus Syntrophosphaera thermopropionivorans]